MEKGKGLGDGMKRDERDENGGVERGKKGREGEEK